MSCSKVKIRIRSTGDLGRIRIDRYICSPSCPEGGHLRESLPMYAIVEIAGHQYKVQKDQRIIVDQLDAKEGEKVTFDKVLLTEDDNGKVQVGTPSLDGVSVKGEVLGHPRGDKVTVFKKKRRKGYKVKNGHRQELSEIRIDEVGGKASASSKKGGGTSSQSSSSSSSASSSKGTESKSSSSSSQSSSKSKSASSKSSASKSSGSSSGGTKKSSGSSQKGSSSSKSTSSSKSSSSKKSGSSNKGGSSSGGSKSSGGQGSKKE